MYKINAIAISLLFSVCVWSQDSLSIKNNFYKQQQNSLLLLSGWSATNLVASPVFCKNLYSETIYSNFKIYKNHPKKDSFVYGNICFCKLSAEQRKNKQSVGWITCNYSFSWWGWTYWWASLVLEISLALLTCDRLFARKLCCNDSFHENGPMVLLSI